MTIHVHLACNTMNKLLLLLLFLFLFCILEQQIIFPRKTGQDDLAGKHDCSSFLDNAVFIKTLPLIIFVSIKTLRRSYWEVDMDVSIIVAKNLSFFPS